MLLNRARSIAAEHARLSAQISENYDVDIARRVGELGVVTTALKDWEDARQSLKELDTLLNDSSSDHELRALAESDIATTSHALRQHTSSLKASLIPPHPFAHLPCLIEIHPGAGGSEASLFAHTLLEMYTGLCKRLGYPHSLTAYEADDSVSSATPGLTAAILEVNQPHAYGQLRTEAGVHRVQRVPSTEKKGRTHTSAVSVLVLPSFPTTSSSSSSDAIDFDSPTSDYYISPADVRSQTMRARGPGGQHVNKTDSAIRLTHVPTGTVVTMQESRSQHKNRELAWRVLRSKIAQLRREEREEEMAALRRRVMGGGGGGGRHQTWGGREDKIRTYNYSQSRVTDHRCPEAATAATGDLTGILNGGYPLEVMMATVREWMVDREIAALILEEEEEEEMKKKKTMK